MRCGLLLLILLSCAAVAETITIGPEAALPVSEQSRFSRAVNFAPADGQECGLNPPRFRWRYHPTVPGQGGNFQFLFQLAQSPDFQAPLVEVKTGINFYNTLAPLPSSGPWYWRIGYFDRDETEAEPTWSDTRSFTLTQDAQVWDRSSLAHPDFAEIAHPRLVLNAQTLPQFRRLIAEPGESRDFFERIRETAEEALESIWWEKVPREDTDEAIVPYLLMAHELAQVAFCYLVTEDPKYAGVKERALLLASYPKGGRASPEGAGGELVEDSTQFNEFLALMYDWLYPQLTPEERKVFEGSLEWRLDHVLNNFSWRQQYPGMPDVTSASLANHGYSHGYEAFFHSFAAALALYERAPVAREYFQVAVNYMAGVGSTHGYDGAWNEGPGYALSKWSWQVNSLCYLDSVFPAYNAGSNPWLRRLGEFLRAQTPAGLKHAPWGHHSNDDGYYLTGRLRAFRKLAYLTGDGRFLADYQRVASTRPKPVDRPWIEAALPVWRDAPEPVYEEDPVRLFVHDGWVTALSGSPILPETYADGVGMIFAARPRGAYSHAFASENSFHWFAYGQDLSHAAGTSDYEPHAFHSMSHNTILVDGLGQAQPRKLQRAPWFARIAAFAQQGRVVYWCGDATPAYPTEPFHADEWWGDLDPIYAERQLPKLKKVRRHVLFIDERYFIILDDLEAETPAQWTWLYHVLEADEFALDAHTGAFDYAVEEVQVKVAHLLGAGQLEAQDLEHAAGFQNPLTGENYRRDRGAAQGKRRLVAEHNVWVSTSEKHTSWRFLAVLYPLRPGEAAPVIEAIENLGVRIVSEQGIDTISFTPTRDATVNIDLQAISAAITAENDKSAK